MSDSGQALRENLVDEIAKGGNVYGSPDGVLWFEAIGEWLYAIIESVPDWGDAVHIGAYTNSHLSPSPELYRFVAESEFDFAKLLEPDDAHTLMLRLDYLLLTVNGRLDSDQFVRAVSAVASQTKGLKAIVYEKFGGRIPQRPLG